MTMEKCLICEAVRTMGSLVLVELKPKGTKILVCPKCLEDLKESDKTSEQ